MWLLTITQSSLVCLKTRTEICECPTHPSTPPTALLRRRPREGVRVLPSTIANVIPIHPRSPSFISAPLPLGAAPCSLSRSCPMSPGCLSHLSVCPSAGSFLGKPAVVWTPPGSCEQCENAVTQQPAHTRGSLCRTHSQDLRACWCLEVRVSSGLISD